MTAPVQALREEAVKLAAKVCDSFHPLSSVYKQLEALTGTLEEISRARPCDGCGGSTTKTFIDYQYDYRQSNDTRLTVSKALPGYRCDTCQVEMGDPQQSD